jgi:hypothetical protein
MVVGNCQTSHQQLISLACFNENISIIRCNHQYLQIVMTSSAQLACVGTKKPCGACVRACVCVCVCVAPTGTSWGPRKHTHAECTGPHEIERPSSY